MIAYFSGTGNSKYVSERLAALTGEPRVFIPTTLPEQVEFSGTSFGIVAPVYAWGVPPVVTDWIRRLSMGFKDDVRRAGGYVWVVLTCGDETGMAPEMIRKVLDESGLGMKSIWSIGMPNVYVLLPGFNVDSKQVEQQKLADSKARIEGIGKAILDRVEVEDVTYGSFPRMKTRLVFPLFKRWGINTAKWHWTRECIGCGSCASVCPVGNIKMKSGHPKWGNDCTSCLACYHVCPTHAVAYGSATEHKGQYFLRRHKD